MDKAGFESQVRAAQSSPVKANFDALFTILKSCGNPVPAETAAALEPLWEQLAGNLNPEGAVFCFHAAALPLPDSTMFRKVLVSSATTLLPPYLNRPPVMRALGVRDEKLSLNEIALRWRKLQECKSGTICFLPSAKRWGVLGTIDNINGTIIINAFAGTGVNSATPLEAVLREALFLAPGPELNKLVSTVGVMPNGTMFRTIVKRRALFPVSDEIMRDMALSGCARSLAPAAWEKYWNSESQTAALAATPGAAFKRSSAQARSLQEMVTLLEGEAAESKSFSAEEAAAFRKFFTALKPETAKREVKLLAQAAAGIVKRVPAETFRQIAEPLKVKAAFWPEKPLRAGFDALSVWGDLSAKDIELLSDATAIVFDVSYLCTLAFVLPLKALNGICARIPADKLCEAAAARHSLNCDLLMWCWKNRKKHQSDDLLKLVNIEMVCRALAATDLPKQWSAAQRELHSSLMDKSDFQLHMLENCSGVNFFASVLSSALAIDPRERQSLLAKMSRTSEKLRNFLENGAAEKILRAKNGEQALVSAPETHTEYTSAVSRKQMQDELDNIINVQQPENREALATARAHGDFRENAEFDAAKERRNFLRRRREELERDLGNIQTMMMRDVKVGKTAVIGCQIDVEFSDTGKESFYLLGARDGNPDRKFLSYRSRLGEAVLDHAVGDEFPVPGNRSCKLIGVKPLPAELIAELDA